MSEFDRYTRVNKFEKRRKNTKLMTTLIVAASFLIVLLIGLWIFGPDDEPANTNELGNSETSINEENTDGNTEETDESEETSEGAENEGSTGTEDDEQSDSSADGEDKEDQNIDTEPTDPVGDEGNVISAFTGDWAPIGTEQQGPHTTTYDEGSVDRIEMEKAIRLATGLAEGVMITWWLENGGDQKVIATVSDRAETKTYRVYLSWIEAEGWQPTLVEELRENDQKWRFE